MPPASNPIHRIVQPPSAGFPQSSNNAAPRVIRTAEGYPLDVPAGWALLPPGDAMLTRRVKTAGKCWVMQEKVGRRLISRGVWAPAERIARVKAEVAVARQDPAYQKKLHAGRKKRAADQVEYARDFENAILTFLDFDSPYAALAKQLARRVADHATPLGSGTVARTKRIPIEERAKAAVIAWMRHHTTPYDRLTIPRIKGRRREVRRKLAKQSIATLRPYRQGQPIPDNCPLHAAINSKPGSTVCRDQVSKSRG